MRVLVIKLGALGDFALAFGPFAAIRAHHREAHITLLTTPPFAALGRAAPWFDAVWPEGRPAWFDVAGLWRLAYRLRAARFDRVYDLQTSARSSRYRLFVGARAEWSGIAKGCSHPHANPARDRLHTVERQREQLMMAGISAFPSPDLGWLDADVAQLGLPERFWLAVPGASPGRAEKRWPAASFAALAQRFALPAVVVGTAAEAPLAAAICAADARAIDLTGRTDVAALAALARRAVFCVGNDTGPVHLAAACGCPTLALFGAGSDPALCAPRGVRAAYLRHLPLAALEPARVEEAVAALVGDGGCALS